MRAVTAPPASAPVPNVPPVTDASPPIAAQATPPPLPAIPPITDAAPPPAARLTPAPMPAGPRPPMPMPMPPAAMLPNGAVGLPRPVPPPPGWRPPPMPPGARPPVPIPPPAAWQPPPPGAAGPLPPEPEAAPAPPPKPRVLELETSGDDVPPLMSQWEMISLSDVGPVPESTEPPPPSSEQNIELAAPWEFVGYQGDAAADLQPPAEAKPAPTPAPAPEPAAATEGPLDPETAASIADAVTKGELDWSSVIAFDGEAPSPGTAEPDAPQVAASAAELAEALEVALVSMQTATQGAMVGEALLTYCRQGFGRAFHFLVQYGVAIFWRGFGPGSDGAVVAFRPDLKEPSMFKTAVDSGKPSVVTIPESSTDESFFWAISPPPPGFAVAVPLMVDGAARELLCVVGDDPGPSPELLGALERLSACAAQALARLSGHA